MADRTDFQKRLMQIGVDGMLSASIALGHRLGLFKALAKISSEEKPATAAQVAQESGCKERYVKEWLAVVGVGDIITVTEDEKFYIKKENVADLTNQTFSIQFNSFLPVFMRAYDKMANVFTKDGPLGLAYSDFTDFYDAMASLSEALHKKHLISGFIPALGSGLRERLEKGGVQCLDVGCGKGFHSSLMASHYPKSHFTGIDITHEAVEMAKRQKKSDGQNFDNLDFTQMNAAKMDANWSNKFDVIMIFDACHDQTRPDLCLKEIYRVLKPGGVFGMLEVNGSSNIYKDKQELGLVAGQMYGCSMFHCLPVSSNSEDALCLGAMWGKERAQKLIKEAGFEQVDVVPTPQFAFNILYVCKKDDIN
ncbi:unnamed protein product [Cylicocyclus nassatus]|uniref:Methyltransferase domain-containing protein n=1 Tax=Cylicocyclus nassatus TaxID=53992 RepID=A0AA36DP77_CYLNA|nr:unnamed protein product [Cylicocyclus nassatus]